MTKELLALLFLLALLAAFFAFEAARHSKNLQKVPLRILVNGTRGKSSVTRLVAAGLRAGGYRTLAKTTGTAARIILPDGQEEDLARRGPANIKEMVGFMARAAQLGAEAVVIECMAIRPELQFFLQQRLVQANLAIITNIRHDHEDVVGVGLERVARAMLGVLPSAGCLVTTEEAWGWLAAVGGQAEVCPVRPEELPEEYRAGFPYVLLAENLALALKTCQLAGVRPQTALPAMRAARPDPGNLTVVELELAGQKVTLINAAAANDRESTLMLWNNYAAGFPHKAVLLNARLDRRRRTDELAGALAALSPQFFLVAGDVVFARAALLRAGVASRDILSLRGEATLDALASAIAGRNAPGMAIFAAGNAKGLEAFGAAAL